MKFDFIIGFALCKRKWSWIVLSAVYGRKDSRGNAMKGLVEQVAICNEWNKYTKLTVHWDFIKVEFEMNDGVRNKNSRATLRNSDIRKISITRKIRKNWHIESVVYLSEV